jgi:hypothetical protein
LHGEVFNELGKYLKGVPPICASGIKSSIASSLLGNSIRHRRGVGFTLKHCNSAGFFVGFHHLFSLGCLGAATQPPLLAFGQGLWRFKMLNDAV